MVKQEQLGEYNCTDGRFDVTYNWGLAEKDGEAFIYVESQKENGDTGWVLMPIGAADKMQQDLARHFKKQDV